MALDPKWSVPGFDRGFDTYYTDFHPGPEGGGGDRYHSVEWRAGEVVKHATGWLSNRPPGPFFVWIHMFDPHDPYDPPQPYKTRYAKALYDGEIAYMDSALGSLFRQLKAAGLYDGALIAVTADHGEALGAHGEDQHGILLYDETVHIPLVIKLPNRQAAGKRIETTVEHADIMPTVLGSLGIAVPGQSAGAVSAWIPATRHAERGGSRESLAGPRRLFRGRLRAPRLWLERDSVVADGEIFLCGGAAPRTLRSGERSRVRSTTWRRRRRRWRTLCRPS